MSFLSQVTKRRASGTSSSEWLARGRCGCRGAATVKGVVPWPTPHVSLLPLSSRSVSRSPLRFMPPACLVHDRQPATKAASRHGWPNPGPSTGLSAGSNEHGPRPVAVSIPMVGGACSPRHPRRSRQVAASTPTAASACSPRHPRPLTLAAVSIPTAAIARDPRVRRPSTPHLISVGTAPNGAAIRHDCARLRSQSHAELGNQSSSGGFAARRKARPPPPPATRHPTSRSRS
jgi:hypothetical protein